MAFLVKPSRDELRVRKKLHESQKTMAYLGQTESFPESAFDAFMEEVVEADPKQQFYRLLFCDGCMDFTAETYWKYQETYSGYEFSILVRGDMRHEGYGRAALRLMKEEALQYDIHRFYVHAAKENQTARSFLFDQGFVEQDDSEVFVLDF